MYPSSKQINMVRKLLDKIVSTLKTDYYGKKTTRSMCIKVQNRLVS